MKSTTKRNVVLTVLYVVSLVSLAILWLATSPPARGDEPNARYRVAVVSAEWCGPCQLLKAALKRDRELREFSAAEVLDADTSDGAAKLRECGSRGIPAVIAIHPTKRAVLIQSGWSGDAKGLAEKIRVKLKKLNDGKLRS